MLYTFVNNSLSLIEKDNTDDLMKRLIDTEFLGEECEIPQSTIDLIEKLGFGWDSLSEPGYLSFKPYSAFMEEATKTYIWKMVYDFCDDINLPLQRISGGDLYSLDNPLMKEHVQLAEKVGMYGDGLLKVTGNRILRFSGCSNKLACLKSINFDEKSLPFGIFEISHSYRYEKKEQLNYLVRNRFFHLPELHIVNESLHNGLEMLVKCHNRMHEDMQKYGLDYVMLFSTTRKFVDENFDFIKKICFECKHKPVINVFDDNSCENGIVFDVEYKAKMSNGSLIEIGTFQIDEGTTGFSYGIKYKDKPVTTVHAVFFASSIERTIFTFCDISANGDKFFPDWLAPVQCRLLFKDAIYNNKALDIANKIKKKLRTEIDDRPLFLEKKLKEAVELKVPYIIYVDENIGFYNYDSNEIELVNENSLYSIMSSSTGENIFSTLLLSQKIL